MKSFTLPSQVRIVCATIAFSMGIDCNMINLGVLNNIVHQITELNIQETG